MIEILRLMIHSPQSVLKGYILDLSFYERPAPKDPLEDNTWAGIIKSHKLLGEYKDGK